MLDFTLIDGYRRQQSSAKRVLSDDGDNEETKERMENEIVHQQRDRVKDNPKKKKKSNIFS